MKKFIGLSAVLFLALAVPVFAQHGGGGHGSGGGAHAGGGAPHASGSHTTPQNHEHTTAKSSHVNKTVVKSSAHWDEGHGRINEDFYRGHFGAEHTFHVHPQFWGGAYHFQYGGFWFGYYDPWPWGWGDPYYIVLDDGDGYYYAYDNLHPGWRTRVVVAVP